MTGFAHDDRAAQFTERVMAEWRRRLDERKEPRPSVGTYNAAFSAVYDAAKVLLSGDSP